MNAILRLSLPLTLWLAAFSAIYGLHGLLCSSRWAAVAPELPGRVLLVGATIAALALQALLLAFLRSPRWPQPDAAIRRVSMVLAVAALVGTAWTLIPALAMSHCL
ncbi:hypothetical protein [Limimaricola cinnabarinus]|uniref:Uncharacterized protein n=1 Tax=Limimaricola cinnabarinus LL-001 TaxID=1337093 RepID=U3AS04_9RHOB|nr:hypothetical protein [Limimaricola cinnabarinus]GAD57513.1 hypothetical protein MBELCI_3565 [Limimaricola cinnabarinus LL-001]